MLVDRALAAQAFSLAVETLGSSRLPCLTRYARLSSNFPIASKVCVSMDDRYRRIVGMQAKASIVEKMKNTKSGKCFCIGIVNVAFRIISGYHFFGTFNFNFCTVSEIEGTKRSSRYTFQEHLVLVNATLSIIQILL